VVFLALAAALLIEQLRALPSSNPFYAAFRRYVLALERALNAGRFEQGVMAWFAAVAPPVLIAAIISIVLYRIAAPLALLWNVAVLYLTMGFRQFSHEFTATAEALRAGDLAQARAHARIWHGAAESLTANEIARLAIERGLLGAHRHVFAVIAWFAVFGAPGAILYRLGALLSDSWGSRASMVDAEFGAFSRVAFKWIDWVPARLTAVSFAVVGDFEDALYCWRTQAHAWQDAHQGIVLASGGGALGVRLGSVVGDVGTAEVRPELGLGEEADAELMTSTVGLIWRALVLWLFLILLLTVAHWLG
jgi:cobalamin biosynthesis protein CobD/CbiB